ncbi:MAG: amidohydrolase family protein [Rhodospirillales bacterium]|nr:amidohydrolase family protein [Rhodospirillales bacterium]
MAKHMRCGTLFTGCEDEPIRDATIVIEGDRIAAVETRAKAPEPKPGDEVVDLSNRFVMPGLSDIHVHLSYGNAKTEEDIDLFASVEYRALRGLAAAQKVLRAGFTSMADPATTGRVSLAIRDAIEAGLFVGPRMTVSGRQITSRQGLSDWYPRWIGVPETSVGVLVRSRDEMLEEVRGQVKDGVDFIKIAIDGDTMNPSTGLAAGFTQEEVGLMVAEAHRLGKKVVVHARGQEATLYSARAGADVILHASWMDDGTVEEVKRSGAMICPTLTMPANNVEFSRPGDPAYYGFAHGHRAELAAARESLTKARRAGVTFLVGTDSGFAITPYGEFHAKELELFVTMLGFTPAEALRCATENNAHFLKKGAEAGVLAPGRLADILIVDGDPLADIRILQDRTRIKDVLLGGASARPQINDAARQLRGETSYTMWNDVYTQARLAELAAGEKRLAAE